MLGASLPEVFSDWPSLLGVLAPGGFCPWRHPCLEAALPGGYPVWRLSSLGASLPQVQVLEKGVDPESEESHGLTPLWGHYGTGTRQW